MRPLRLLLVLALGAGVVLIAVHSAGADPNVPNIAPHRHFMATPSGNLVQVGPRLCDNPSLQQSFNQFHINIHISAVAPGVPITTLGPQHGAPGVHNLQGAELAIRPCSFQG